VLYNVYGFRFFRRGINMKKRKGGFTLTEILVYMAIAAILFTMVLNGLENRRQKQEFSIQKRNISMFIRKIQQYAQYNRKVYVMDFQISKGTVYFVDENSGKRDIIDKLEISRNISYMTNNTNKNADFIRHTTEEGNFEKGFSVYLMDKKGSRIYYRISTNTINAAKYPIISIYRAKSPIDVKQDYTNTALWEEEL